MLETLNLSELIQLILVPLFVFALGFYYYAQQAVTDVTLGPNKEFYKFQKIYFFPYFTALFADWLQGPYVYKLYSHYGFAQDQIAILYITGFAASVTFGTATGPLADKFGRKKMSIVFCLLYSICCLTKLSSSFSVLLAGRVLGGVSTSILFSVFESWYIHQHTIVWKYPVEWMSITFSKATFFNGLLAIGAGIVAEFGAIWMDLGPVSPFMFAIPCLIAGSICVYFMWEENYGQQEMKWQASCGEGFMTIIRNPRILALGLVQSLFESTMYIFVFLWTPVLEPGKPPLGLTFSTFMIAIMIGSSAYAFLLSKGYKSESILNICLLIMSSCMYFSAFTSDSRDGRQIYLIYPAFLVLEVSVGLYFPCIGYLRGEVIPEGLRANIMNWFRVPMNIITCCGLIGMHHLNHPNANQLMFLFCGISTTIGFMISYRFSKMNKGHQETLLNLKEHHINL